MTNKCIVFVFIVFGFLLCFHVEKLYARKNSCSTTHGMRVGIQVCIPPRSNTIVSVSWAGLTSAKKNKGINYRDNIWYMTNDISNTGWKTLVADEGNRWTKTWGTTTYAQYHKKLLTISRTDEGVQIVINTIKYPLIPPSFKGKTDITCWGFYLWAHTSGADPKFLIIFCEESKEEGGSDTSPWTVGVKVKEVKTVDDWFRVATGVSGNNNNWLLMVEQAAKMTKKDCVVCMEPRPLLRVTPAIITKQCLLEVMTKTNLKGTCVIYDAIFPLAAVDEKKPLFSKKIAPANFTCVNITGTGKRIGNLTKTMCTTVITVNDDFNPISRADVWWWCGDDRLFDRLPRKVTGFCALVSLLLPVSKRQHLQKREVTWKNTDTDPTYIDAIGVPRGVPDEYKLVDQVGAGFESTICWWCTINKNVDRINYIHYNVQRLGNWTQAGFEAVHEQLAATSLMAFQNRIALDMLLAEKGGVSADGSLTKAITGLRTLNGKMKEHSGVDTSMWDAWMDAFGKYRNLVSSVLVSIAVFAAILTLCGCCFVPCLRSLFNRLITTAISPMEDQMAQMYPLLEKKSDVDKEYSDDDSSDRYPDPGFWTGYNP
uniref:Uncharacterized protein n=1 Tax=Xiphophorus couchianus TaxID=32473 RepID=A0A3B5LIQ5_9TELE